MQATHSSYPVAVRWTGERRGIGSSRDGLPDLEFAPPPAFNGPQGVWTPEHLFVLAAASCWLTTFLAVAAASKVEVDAVECPGEGALERGDDRLFRITRIVLRPRIRVARQSDQDLVLRLAQKAESVCLIRNSMRTEITLEPEVSVAAAALNA